MEDRWPAVAAGVSVGDEVRRWRPDTYAVRGGLTRSEFDETSEAVFLTSGFVYDSAQQAEAAFKDEIDKFIYSRYGNPTVAMFEERWRLDVYKRQAEDAGQRGANASLFVQRRDDHGNRVEFWHSGVPAAGREKPKSSHCGDPYPFLASVAGA